MSGVQRTFAAILAACAALIAPAAAQAAFPGTNGRIAFDRPGQGIFDVNPDGSGLRQLTTGRCDADPSYAPNGLTIAFDSCGSLFAMGADGSARRTLPAPPNAARPVFDPTGTRVAFQGGRFVTGVYGEALDGSGLQTVATHAYGAGWSPSGTIALSVPVRDAEWCNSTSLQDLWSVTNGHRRRLTKTYASYDPDFSPDGKRMVFTRDDTVSARDIKRVKGIPDCRRVVLMRAAARRYGEEVFVAQANGHGLRRLTTHGGRAPVFSPDGTQIAFERRPYIYVMNADGSGLRKLAQGSHPSWQPLPAPPPAAPQPAPQLP